MSFSLPTFARGGRSRRAGLRGTWFEAQIIPIHEAKSSVFFSFLNKPKQSRIAKPIWPT